MRHFFIPLTVVLLSALLLTSCASSPPSAPKKDDNARKKAENRVGRIVRNQADIKLQLGELAGTVENLMGKMEENNFFTQAVIDELKKVEEQVANLNALVIESNSVTGRRLDIIYDELEERSAEVSSKLNDILAKLSRKKKVAKKKIKANRKAYSIVSAEKLYQDGISNYRNGYYKEAIKDFSIYLSKFPKTELSDNSKYWVGESLLKLGKRKEAVQTFLSVVAKFPSSVKAPKAYYRAAETLVTLKKNKKAVEILKNLVKDYPDSTQASMAEQKISELE